MWCYSRCSYCRRMCQVCIVLQVLWGGGCSRVKVVPLPQPCQGLHESKKATQGTTDEHTHINIHTVMEC